ncbi:MAG TPA: hypothetical protein ENI23_11485 [bacterium]|nr:hypothetical protein [bacterium]
MEEKIEKKWDTFIRKFAGSLQKDDLGRKILDSEGRLHQITGADLFSEKIEYRLLGKHDEPIYKRYYLTVDEIMPFIRNARWECGKILMIARMKEKKSPFYSDYLPNDIFRLIYCMLFHHNNSVTAKKIRMMNITKS